MAGRNRLAYHKSNAASLELLRQDSLQKRVNEAETRLRDDQKANHNEIKNEIGDVRAEIGILREEMGNLRDEMNEKFKSQDSKTDKLADKFDTFQMWMFGLVFTMLVGFMGLFFAIIFTR